MIHYVLLTRDAAGRNVVDSRVIEVDRSDGLDEVGRVNAGIDLVLDAARERGHSVGPIGVAAREGMRHRTSRWGGSGTRRQVQLVSEEAAVVAYLTGTGQIDRYRTVVVADCGDTGMSLYTVRTSDSAISGFERTDVLGGRLLDDAIADHLADARPDVGQRLTARSDRTALLRAARMSKEEAGGVAPLESVARVTDSDTDGRLFITPADVESAARPLIERAREVLGRYLSEHPAEAVVLVGGLANLDVLRDMVPADEPSAADIVAPSDPELVAATGAAMLARQGAQAPSRLAFLGGNRRRRWLSPVPIAVAAAIVAAVVMAAYAMDSALTGQSRPVLPASTSVAATTDVTTTEAVTSRGTAEAPSPIPQTTETPWLQRDEAGPRWATTELPPTTSVATRTLSATSRPVVPETSTPPPTTTRPTLPLPPGISIPPDLLPPNLRPSRPSTPPSTSPTPRQPPRDDAPSTTTTTPMAGLLPPP
ncbi:hypothetical protein ACWDTD_05760 [Gordonia sp. NPDC003425]